MKKLLLYIAIAIVIVACGVSIYYVVRNDENIYSTSTEGEIIYMNTGESIDIPVIHERPNSKTKLNVASNSEIIEVDEENWKVKALQAGDVKLTITSSNEKFGPFEILITVGNGSVDFPYFIRNEEDLIHVGKDEWSLGSSYYLLNDIELTKPFQPIGETGFTGQFDGGNCKITNLVIDSTVAKAESPAGLFSVIAETGKVENLIIENANVNVLSRFSGIIAGKNYGLVGKCQILDSSITNKIPEEYDAETADSYTGVICGLNETKSAYAQVRLCTVKAKINSDYIAGGLVGYNKAGLISNNLVEIIEANMSPAEANKDEYLFGGLVGRSTNSTGDNPTSIFVNNLAILETISADLSRVGGLFGVISTNDINQRGYYSMLVFNSQNMVKPTSLNINEFNLSSSSSVARNYVANITKSEMNQKATYTGIKNSTWDTKNIWTIKDNRSIAINYANEELDYQSLTEIGPVFEISDKKSLARALDNMRLYPTAKVVYKILGESTTETVVDSEGNEEEVKKEKAYTFKATDKWTPIGSKEEPFEGTIIAEKDAIITIKNLDVSEEYAGLFGCLGQNAHISNIKLDGASISGVVCGGITSFNNGGTIENCTVEDCTITSEKYAGAVAGYSNGNINNVIANNNKINVEEETEKNIYVGGIVGKTESNLAGAKVRGAKIQVTFESKENTVFLGGIAGLTQNAKIENSEVFDISANTSKYEGRTYAGGISGYVIGASILSCGVSSESSTSRITLNPNNSSSIVGGIAGFLKDGEVKRCAVGEVELNSHSSAGIVSFNMGDVVESYAGTEAYVEGKYAGGMTCNLYGNILNSYSLATLIGSDIEAGMTNFLWKGSKIEHCYTYCSYTGEGEAYAETYSNYKARKDLFGVIENSVIVGSNIAKDENGNEINYAKPAIDDFWEVNITTRDGQKKVRAQVIFLFIKGTHNYILEDDLKGMTDLYQIFKDLGFDDVNTWGISYSDIGCVPSIINVYNLGEFAFDNLIEDTEDAVDESEEAEQQIAA